MARSFHFGTKGPSPCSAQQGNCPYGGESGQDNHFDTLADAAAAYEKQNNSQNVFSISKDSILQNMDSDQAILVASKRDVSRQTLLTLSKHEEPTVRAVVASSPNASEKLLKKLSTDSVEDVRSAAAGNTRINKDDLVKMAEDKSTLVKISALLNPNTPKSVVDKADVTNLSIALAVSANDQGNVSAATFRKLKKVDDNEVYTRLAGNGKAPADVVTDSIIGLRQADSLMESHPAPPKEAIKRAWEVHTAEGRIPSEEQLELYISSDDTPKEILNEIRKIQGKKSKVAA